MEWHEDEVILDEIDGMLLYMDGQLSSIMQKVYRYIQDDMTAERAMAFSLAAFVRYYSVAREQGSGIEEATRIAGAAVAGSSSFQQLASDMLGIKFDEVVSVAATSPPVRDFHE